MFKFSSITKIVVAFISVSACEGLSFQGLKEGPSTYLKQRLDSEPKEVGPSKRSDRATTFTKIFKIDRNSQSDVEKSVLNLSDLVARSSRPSSITTSFSNSLKQAVTTDPAIMASVQDLAARRASIGISESQREFQVSGNLYAGVEDVTDQTAGAAVVLNANRLLFDGGKLESELRAESLNVDSFSKYVQAQIDEKAFNFSSAWIDLERYEVLNEKIESRLGILNPIITQLEKVKDAGIGDMSQVAAAQRTVSKIRVTQTNVSEGLDQARINFINAFGGLPGDMKFDAALIDGLLPMEVTVEMENNAPAIQSEYFAYKAAEARLQSIQAKDNYNISFRSTFSRPIGESDHNSDESIGIAVSRTFYDGNKLDAELAQAAALVRSAKDKLAATHREAILVIENSKQTLESMSTAIELANINADITANEIAYLRQQLVIGGSTLESVLSAEAQLYEADSTAVNFLAEQRKAKVSILTALGLLSPAIGLAVD